VLLGFFIVAFPTIVFAGHFSAREVAPVERHQLGFVAIVIDLLRQPLCSLASSSSPSQQSSLQAILVPVK